MNFSTRDKIIYLIVTVIIIIAFVYKRYRDGFTSDSKISKPEQVRTDPEVGWDVEELDRAIEQINNA
jgi:hypothetical protein